MNNKYACIDRAGILRITGSREQAEGYSANGKVIETAFPTIRGYPYTGEVPAGKSVNGEYIVSWGRCKLYTIKSLEDAQRTGIQELADLYAGLM